MVTDLVNLYLISIAVYLTDTSIQKRKTYPQFYVVIKTQKLTKAYQKVHQTNRIQKLYRRRFSIDTFAI